jgi:hypothetical protein
LKRFKETIRQAPFADVQKLVGDLIKHVEAEKDEEKRAFGRHNLEELKPLYYARRADELARHQEHASKRAERFLEDAKASKDAQTGMEVPKSPQKPKQRGGCRSR